MQKDFFGLVGFRINEKFKHDIKSVVKLFIFIFVIVLIYATLFQYFMHLEERDYSFFDGIYWTLVTMSTLGYGDIVFDSTIGHLFSLFVLISGVVILLVILPYTFIQFFYTPWLEAQEEAKAPRKLPDTIKGHVIITTFDPVAEALVERLKNYKIPYVFLFRGLRRATEVHDLGYNVALGDYDDPQTWKNMRINHANCVVSMESDMQNTAIAFNIREMNKDIPIITTANSEDSVDILKLAGSTNVLQMGKILGSSLARRTMGGSARVHVIAHFENLIVGEAPVVGTPLVGKKLGESKLRENTGMNAVGVWESGKFHSTKPDFVLTDKSVLVLVGSIEHMRRYDELFGIYHAVDAPVIIIGGGRVGRAAAKALRDRKISYKIIEKRTNMIRNTKKYVVGDAADLETLKEAGIDDAHTIIITTHDDEMNIYLTIYCRKLRPDIQITTRATFERNINTIHRAGADFVMSYAKMGANSIYNIIDKDETLMLAEGLNIFKIEPPEELIGKHIRDTEIREKTGCTVVALNNKDDKEEYTINPSPDLIIEKNQEVILIGTSDEENAFYSAFNIKK